MQMMEDNRRENDPRLYREILSMVRFVLRSYSMKPVRHDLNVAREEMESVVAPTRPPPNEMDGTRTTRVQCPPREAEPRVCLVGIYVDEFASLFHCIFGFSLTDFDEFLSDE